LLVAEKQSFGERLKELREKAKLSKTQLAQKAKLSKQAISQLEKPGGGDPSWDTVKKLAHALGIPIDEFDTDKPGDEKEGQEADEKPAPKKKPNGNGGKPKK
jgi:transcriptional regulator with XRE-family HTH domain